MPELGKATYRLIFDTREFDVGLADAETRAVQATNAIADAVGKADDALLAMGPTADKSAGQVGAAAGEMETSFTEVGTAAEGMAAKVGAAESAVGKSAKEGAAAAEGAATKQASSWAKMNTAISGMGKNLKSAGRELTHTFTLPVALIGGVAAKLALDYSAKIALLGTQAGASDKEVKAMYGDILKLSQVTPQGPDALADAMFHIESTGYRGAKALQVLKAASDGAMVGMTDLDSVTYALVSALHTGLKGAGDMAQTMGVLNAIIGAGDMRMGDLTAALSTGIGPAAKGAGLGFKEIGAALDVMTSRGMPAQISATRLAQTLAFLQKQSSGAQKELDKLGIGQNQLAIMLQQPNGLYNALKFLKERLDAVYGTTGALAQAQKNSAILTLFGGGRSGKAAQLLIQNLDDLNDRYQTITENVGKYNQAVADARAQPINQLKIAWSNLQSKLIELGKEAIPVLLGLAKGVISIVDAFERLPTPVKAFIIGTTVLLALLGPLLSMIGFMTIGVTALIGPLIALAAAENTAAAGAGTLAIAVGALEAVSAPILLLVAAIVALGAAMIAAEVAPKQLQQGLQRIGLSAHEAYAAVEVLRIGFIFFKNAILTSIRVLEAQILMPFRLLIDFLHGDWKQAILDAVSPFTALGRGIIAIFDQIWSELKSRAIRAALDIVEPFTHLPKWLGGWARAAKDRLETELAQQNAAKAKKNAKMLVDSYGSALVPGFGSIGQSAGDAFNAGFITNAQQGADAFFKQFLTNAGRISTSFDKYVAIWDAKRKEWVNKNHKAIADQQQAWDAFNQSTGKTLLNRAAPKAGTRVTVTPKTAATPGSPPFTGVPKPPTQVQQAQAMFKKSGGFIMPDNFQRAEAQAQASGSEAALKKVYGQEEDYIKGLINSGKFHGARLTALWQALAGVKGNLDSVNKKGTSKLTHKANTFTMPYRFQLRETKAARTKGQKDDLAVLTDEETYLKKLLENRKMTKAKRLAIQQQLTTVITGIQSINDAIAQKLLNLPLITPKMRIRETKAERTKKLGDDIKVQQDELKYLKHLLTELPKTKKYMDERATIEEQITATMQKIADLKKQQADIQKKSNSESAALAREVMGEQASFFSSFGSTVFSESSSGGPQPNRTPGTSGSNIPQYRASGGPIWGPRGTDKVSAWLTPGELVLNKRQIVRLADRLGVPRTPEAIMAVVKPGNEPQFRGGETHVHVHQHFPSKTENLYREAIYAETAFKHAFDAE